MRWPPKLDERRVAWTGQMKPVRKKSPSTPAGEARGLARALSGDAGQQGRVAGRDLVPRQAVDALDVERPRRDGRRWPAEPSAVSTVIRAGGGASRSKPITNQPSAEAWVHGRAVQQHGGAGRCAADDHAALHEAARQHQAGRGGAAREAGKRQGAPVRPAERRSAVQPRLSCQRFRASVGPA